jgi:hypothetical protein
VNFTREPVIETVITPKESCKLLVRNSKGVDQEDYYVDAIEIVSFGKSLFFRSKERPKSFLVPVSDYEIIELKETRMVLKTTSVEKTIKIGNKGKGPSQKTTKEEKPKEKPHESARTEKKREKRRSKRRGATSSENEVKEETKIKQKESKEEKGKERKGNEEDVIPSVPRKLFPPPNTLIKEKLSLLKNAAHLPQEEIRVDEAIEQEDFIIEENENPFPTKGYAEDFQKNLSDPEVFEEKVFIPKEP